MNPVVRSAAPEEWERLPVLPRWHLLPGDECFVAEAESPRRLVGAAIFGARTLGDGKKVAQIDLAVMPRFMNTGTMAHLLKPLLARATGLGFRKVHLIGPRRRPSRELTLLEQLGFTERHSNIIYEFSSATLHERTGRICERLTRRNAIPEGVEVTGLRAIHWPGVVQLLRAEHLLDPGEQAVIEGVGLRKYYHPSSCVMLLKGEVKGALLTRAQGRMAEACARVVAPELRGGRSWANAVLIHQATSVGMKSGLEIVIMRANLEKHLETMMLARTMEATECAREIFLAQDLEDGA